MDVKAKVVRLTDFGAFVELEDGVEGLLHISELSHDRVAKPEDVVSIDQELCLRIIKLDANERKLGLSLRAYQDSQDAPSNPTDQAPSDQRPSDQQEEGTTAGA
jgi:ribosomal protein S1